MNITTMNQMTRITQLLTTMGNLINTQKTDITMKISKEMEIIDQGSAITMADMDTRLKNVKLPNEIMTKKYYFKKYEKNTQSANVQMTLMKTKNSTLLLKVNSKK